MIIVTKIKFLKSRSGRQYVGCDIQISDLANIMDQFLIHYPRIFKLARRNQIKRDGNEFHITILSPSEFSNLEQSHVNTLTREFIDYSCSIEIIGLGMAQNREDFAFFGIVKSLELDAVREKLKIVPRDFHITIGFYDRDVHGVCKDESTLVRVPDFQ